MRFVANVAYEAKSPNKERTYWIIFLKYPSNLNRTDSMIAYITRDCIIQTSTHNQSQGLHSSSSFSFSAVAPKTLVGLTTLRSKSSLRCSKVRIKSSSSAFVALGCGLRSPPKEMRPDLGVASREGGGAKDFNGDGANGVFCSEASGRRYDDGVFGVPTIDNGLRRSRGV